MSTLTAEVAGARVLTETPSEDELVELQEMCDAADDVVAQLTGSAAAAESVWSGRCRPGDLLLPWRFDSIESVVVDGVTIAPTAYDAVTGASSGILRGAPSAPWASGQTVTVTANTGGDAAAIVYLALIEMVGHWWQLRQQRGKGSFTPDGNAYSIHSVPYKVTEMLAMRPGLPGIA